MKVKYLKSLCLTISSYVELSPYHAVESQMFYERLTQVIGNL